MTKKLVAAYGSQNGTAQEYAETVYLEGTMKGYSVRLLTLDELRKELETNGGTVISCSLGSQDWQEETWDREQAVVMIISNTGDGDPPDNATGFWQWIHSSLKSDRLAGIKVALLGLGDSDYASFNNTGKYLAARLPSLGASWLIPPAFCDAQEGNDVAADPWMETLWNAIRQSMEAEARTKAAEGLSQEPSNVADSQLSLAMAAASLEEEGDSFSLWQIPFQSDLGSVETSALPTLHPVTVAVDYDPVMVEASPVDPSPAIASFDNPIRATNVSFQVLTAPEAVKTVRLVSFDAKDDRWSCQAGDAFGIFCQNSVKAVKTLLSLLDLPGKQLISIRPLVPTKPETFLGSVCGRIWSLEEIFRDHADIMHFPKKSFIRHLAEFCHDPREREQLLYLCSKAGSANYLSLANSHASVLDFLGSFPSCKPSLECLFSHLPLLHPRYFSVCSATQDPCVQFVYSTMSYTMPDGSSRSGVCTAWLDKCARSNPANLEFRIFPRPSPHFRLPLDPKVPVIMICAGTGVSPFVGFLRSLARTAQRRSMLWLFYGFRNRRHDYLFGDELERYLQDGLLSRITVAASREPDSRAPRYVQDALRESYAEVYRLMTASNGCIYICGDELTMIKDVNRELQLMIAAEEGVSEPDAQSILQSWSANKKIIRDVWV